MFTTSTTTHYKPVITLDEWDFKFIQYFKRAQQNELGDLKKLWGERCEIDPNYPGILNAMVFHFLPIISGLELRSMPDMVYMACPDCRWQYSMHKTLRPNLNPTEQYMLDWLAVIGSVLMLSEVVKLPGYVEWLNAEGKA